jgi:FkbM family methyltransferase
MRLIFSGLNGNMLIYSKLKQRYRYHRNWKKYQSRQSNVDGGKEDTAELNFYSQFIKSGDLCFDIGANIGDKTDVFVRLGAVVVAVEPQECCWRVLRRRFKNEEVFVEPVALDHQKGSRTMFVDKSHTLSSLSRDWIATVKQSGRFSTTHKWNERLSVPTSTLDDLIAKYGTPVFCKIDVEGVEYDVLQGLSQPAGVMSIEFVSERIEPSIKCIDYLSGLGKAEFNYYLGGSMSFALPAWVNSDGIKTILTDMDKDIYNYGELYIRFISQ